MCHIIETHQVMLQVILASDVVYEADSAAALAAALARHLEEAEGRALLCCPVRDQVRGLLWCRHVSCFNGSHIGNLQLDHVLPSIPYASSTSNAVLSTKNIWHDATASVADAAACKLYGLCSLYAFMR